MTLLIAAIALGTPVADVSDYFPMKPGSKWFYEEDGATGRFQDVVKSPVDIDGKETMPIETTLRIGERQKVIDTRYYRIEGNTLLLIASDPKNPIPTPQPVLKVGTGKLTWTYDGKAMFYNDWVPMTYKAESAPKGKRSINGEDRECIELTMDATIEAGLGVKMVTHQVSLYASGIGLVEMHQKQKIGNKTSESTTKLVRFEPAK